MRAAQNQGVGQGGRAGNPVELILLLVGERERLQFASAWDGSLLCNEVCRVCHEFKRQDTNVELSISSFGLGPVNTYLSASKMSTKWMKPMNITSSFSNRENIRR